MRSMAMAFPVRCEIGGQTRQTTSRELGERGVFIYCAELPALHAAARLTLYLPNGPLEVPATDANRSYLRTKREKLGHLFSSFPD